MFAIRLATPDDATAILECLRLAFAPYQSQYTIEGYRDTVLTAETIPARFDAMDILVAVDRKGGVIGTVACEARADGEGHLRGMAVAELHQGGGVAAALLATAERRLRQRGCRLVSLDTTAPLIRARAFYEKHGFRRSGRVDDFFGMPLYEYVKTIEEDR